VREDEWLERLRARARPGAGVLLGIGDDAAVLRAPSAVDWVLTTDSLVDGVHLPQQAGAADWGHKLAAVNLSDLAAMGADPVAALLNLTLPELDPVWLEPFFAALDEQLARHGAVLVGGNTARGPRVLGLTAIGTVPGGRALSRSGARPGDGVYVSGTLGGAALGLERLMQGREAAASWVERQLRPTPRVELGRALRDLASACIDVSDGLARDLDRLARASGVGAALALDVLPLEPGLPAQRAESLALYGGEDYELLFTVAPEQEAALCRIADRLAVRLTRIGVVTAQPGLRAARGGVERPLPVDGFDHFR
jgi:thiamine-monophosphate kinase